MKHVLPKWFYHEEICPSGKIIYTEEQFNALEEGWVETPLEFGKKQDAPLIEEKVAENQKTAIKEADFTKMKVAELKSYLVEKGVAADDLDGLKKDELIAKIGDLK